MKKWLLDRRRWLCGCMIHLNYLDQSWLSQAVKRYIKKKQVLVELKVQSIARVRWRKKQSFMSLLCQLQWEFQVHDEDEWIKVYNIIFQAWVPSMLKIEVGSNWIWLIRLEYWRLVHSSLVLFHWWWINFKWWMRAATGGEMGPIESTIYVWTQRKQPIRVAIIFKWNTLGRIK